MIFSHIVAVLENGVMAIDGNLPCGYWKEDMGYFQRTTQQALVFMGNRTTKTLPKPLDRRWLVSIGTSLPCRDSRIHKLADVVISSENSDKVWDASMKKMYDANTFPLANKEIGFVAGGAHIYRESLLDMDLVHINVLKPFIPPLIKQTSHLLYYPMLELQENFIMISNVVETTSKGVIEYQVWKRKVSEPN